jgi:uncharacterized protein YjbJ (UPF0337 family)
MFEENGANFLLAKSERHSLSTTKIRCWPVRAARGSAGEQSRSVLRREREARNFLDAIRFLFIRRIAMNENRVEGAVRNAGGKVQEGFGRMRGDARTRAEGIANQAAGKAQELYGQAAETAQETASTLDDWLRHQIRTQPYTSALVALGIGWLLGRMHRPL